MLLAAVVIVVFSTAVVLPFVLYAELTPNGDAGSSIDSTGISAAGMVAGLLAQQLAMGCWPVWVARRKGFGVKHDFGFRIRPIDLLYGFFGGLGLLMLATLVGSVTTALTGLDHPAEASNTQVLTDSRGSLAFYFIVFAVVIGAPLSEELLFRGLLLRAAEKKWNVPAAVVLSTVVFTAVHYTGSTLAGTAVLFASIGTLGAGLALLTLFTGRLGAAIVAHVTVNGLAVMAGLLA